MPESVEEQEDLDVEQPLPKPPAGVKEQEGQDFVNLLPKPSGDVRTPISLRKLGMLLIGLPYLSAWASAEVSCLLREIIRSLFCYPGIRTLHLLRLHLPLLL